MKEEKRKKPTKKFTTDTWSWDSVSHSAEIVYVLWLGLPQGAAGGMGSVSGSGRSPGRGRGNPAQHSCLENPMDRGACWVTAHRVTKSQTRLKRLRYSPMHVLCLDPHNALRLIL